MQQERQLNEEDSMILASNISMIRLALATVDVEYLRMFIVKFNERNSRLAAASILNPRYSIEIQKKNDQGVKILECILKTIDAIAEGERLKEHAQKAKDQQNEIDKIFGI